jgi:ribonuclease P protein component
LMAGLTLPKGARLSRRAEFDLVRTRGRSWHGKFMVMGGWISGEEGTARCGVVTSRKTGPAVDRSRIRRRLREIFRLHRGSLPNGLWMVVVARRAAATADYGALSEEWRALARRAGYWKI